MTNADKFKHLFGIYATELWVMPQSDFLEWLNADSQNMSTTEQRWIPCSERLPEEKGRYIVTLHQSATADDLGFYLKDYDVRKMYYDTETGWRIPKKLPQWVDDAVISTVLAWMRLPEPYREGET